MVQDKQNLESAHQLLGGVCVCVSFLVTSPLCAVGILLVAINLSFMKNTCSTVC